jgi:PAS fold
MRRFELPSGTSDRGCSVPDLLAARLKAGTFSLDPERYDADLRAARMQGRAFALNVDLKDGRTIAVVNQPMPGGGWVASRCADRSSQSRRVQWVHRFHDRTGIGF